MRGEGFIGKFEPELVIAFARAAMDQGIRVFVDRNLDLALGQDGSIYVAETRTKRVVKLRPVTTP